MKSSIQVGQIREWDKSYRPPYIIKITRIEGDMVYYRYLDSTEMNEEYGTLDDRINAGTKLITKSTGFKNLYDKLSS